MAKKTMIEPAVPNSDLTPTPTPTKPEMVEVSADVLAKMQEQLERLTAAADVQKLAAYDSLRRADGEIIRKVLVNFFDDKPIGGWHMPKNVSYVKGSGIQRTTVEEQTISLKFFGDDGKLMKETTEVDYLEWYRLKYEQGQEAEVLGVNTKIVTLEDGLNVKQRIYNVRLKNGRELEINAKYVN